MKSLADGFTVSLLKLFLCTKKLTLIDANNNERYKTGFDLLESGHFGDTNMVQ